MVLATTDKCKNSLIKHKKKTIYCAQFHADDPDYYGRKYGINQNSDQDPDTMIMNFENIVLHNSKSR